VEVAGVPVPAPGVPWPDGQDVMVAIRPEDLQPVERAAADDFAGTVDVVMDLGHFRQVDLLLSQGGTLRVFVGKESRIAAGDSLRVRPSRALAFVSGADPVELTREGQPVAAL
jgi:hypothetical protein